MRLFLHSLILLLALCTGAAAQQSTRIALAWSDWLAAQGDPAGALVLYDGTTELVALGAVDAPLPLASNSKAITAACTAALVEEGLLSWDQTLGGFYGRAARRITVADLVTHQTGLWPDSTQAAMPGWLDAPEPQWHSVSETAFGRSRQGAKKGSFRYNNENYAILGDLIEQATGQPYESACRSRILAPLALTSARLSARFGAFGPWGGWEMSVRDYARFVQAYVAPQDPFQAPHAKVDTGLVYGLGMMGRKGRNRANQWHFGALCFETVGLGAYAVSWGGRYTLVASYEACASWEAMVALDQAMVRAVFAE